MSAATANGKPIRPDECLDEMALRRHKMEIEEGELDRNGLKLAK
jgi:hypothetical protein